MLGNIFSRKPDEQIVRLQTLVEQNQNALAQVLRELSDIRQERASSVASTQTTMEALALEDQPSNALLEEVLFAVSQDASPKPRKERARETQQRFTPHSMTSREYLIEMNFPNPGFEVCRRLGLRTTQYVKRVHNKTPAFFDDPKKTNVYRRCDLDAVFAQIHAELHEVYMREAK
jgi:hypothetical protein